MIKKSIFIKADLSLLSKEILHVDKIKKIRKTHGNYPEKGKILMEQKAQKQWLISFIVITVYTCFFICLTLMKNALVPIAIIAIVGTLSYYLAYHKKNTRWLLWILVIRGLSITLTTMQMIYLFLAGKIEAFFLPIVASTGLSLWLVSALWIISLGLSMFYWYSCYQLKAAYSQAKQLL